LAKARGNLAFFGLAYLLATGLNLLHAAPFAPRFLPDIGDLDWLYSWAPHLIAVMVAGARLEADASLSRWALLYALAALVLGGAPALAIYLAFGGLADWRAAEAAIILPITAALVAAAQFLIGWLLLALIRAVKGSMARPAA
jgi:hypothetical protein